MVSSANLILSSSSAGQPRRATKSYIWEGVCSETFLANSGGSVSYLQLWTMSSNLLLLETAPPSHAGDCPSILVCVLFGLQDNRPPGFFLFSLSWLILSISVSHLLHSCTLSSPMCSLLHSDIPCLVFSLFYFLFILYFTSALTMSLNSHQFKDEITN